MVFDDYEQYKNQDFKNIKEDNIWNIIKNLIKLRKLVSKRFGQAYMAYLYPGAGYKLKGANYYIKIYAWRYIINLIYLILILIIKGENINGIFKISNPNNNTEYLLFDIDRLEVFDTNKLKNMNSTEEKKMSEINTWKLKKKSYYAIEMNILDYRWIYDGIRLTKTGDVDKNIRSNKFSIIDIVKKLIPSKFGMNGEDIININNLYNENIFNIIVVYSKYLADRVFTESLQIMIDYHKYANYLKAWTLEKHERSEIPITQKIKKLKSNKNKLNNETIKRLLKQ